MNYSRANGKPSKKLRLWTFLKNQNKMRFFFLLRVFVIKTVSPNYKAAAEWWNFLDQYRATTASQIHVPPREQSCNLICSILKETRRRSDVCLILKETWWPSEAKKKRGGGRKEERGGKNHSVLRWKTAGSTRLHSVSWTMWHGPLTPRMRAYTHICIESIHTYICIESWTRIFWKASKGWWFWIYSSWMEWLYG